VSRGPEPIPVPDVTGDTADSAANTLGQAGFPTTTRLEPSDSVEAGRVIRTEPPANTPLVPGETVVLVVSSGPAPVTVPPVVGLSQEAATSALTQAGFQVEVVEQEIDPEEFPGVEDGEVIDQNPDGNTQAPPGSTVTITVARLQQGGGGG
jgi:eukaryotic-like serine/threonine-protein kinase